MATFNNTATLSYNDRVTNSNVVTGEIVEILSATKNVLDGTYGAGDTLTYIISIVNSGTNAVTDVSVTDNLGEYVTETGITVYPLTYRDGTVRLYSDGTLSATPTVTAGPPFVFSDITVPAGGNVVLIYQATANAYAPLASDLQIVNEATIAGENIALPITVTATALAESEPELTISKSVSPETIVEDGQITYTFVIQNSGNLPATATDNAVVTDNFDPILSNITVTLNGETLSAGEYSYDTATGEFSTTAGVITVPAATYAVDDDGRWTVTPGVAILKVAGTV